MAMVSPSVCGWAAFAAAQREVSSSGALSAARQDFGQAEQRDDFNSLYLLAIQVAKIALVAGDEESARTPDRGAKQGGVLGYNRDGEGEEDGGDDLQTGDHIEGG